MTTDMTPPERDWARQVGAGRLAAMDRVADGQVSDPLLAALLRHPGRDAAGRAVGHDRQPLRRSDLSRIAVVLRRPDLTPPPIDPHEEQAAVLTAGEVAMAAAVASGLAANRRRLTVAEALAGAIIAEVATEAGVEQGMLCTGKWGGREVARSRQRVAYRLVAETSLACESIGALLGCEAGTVKDRAEFFARDHGVPRPASLRSEVLMVGPPAAVAVTTLPGAVVWRLAMAVAVEAGVRPEVLFGGADRDGDGRPADRRATAWLRQRMTYRAMADTDLPAEEIAAALGVTVRALCYRMAAYCGRTGLLPPRRREGAR